jgi:hypothetical protein
MRQPHHREGAVGSTPFGGFLEMLAQGGAALRRAPNARFRRAMVPGPPAPGTVEHQRQQMEWARTLPDVRDLRSDDRKATDRLWRRALADVEKRHGVVLSADETGQADPAMSLALRRARDAEATFLRLSGAPDAAPAAVDQAFDNFTKLMAAWLNRATAGMPTANERARAAARERSWR